MADFTDLHKKRIDEIRKLYYSNPKIIEALVKFSINREVVPRYFEGFGKRPDAIQYSSDISALVGKGATSFHCSEELWNDPLKINNDLSVDQVNGLRKGWDLLIDIDSPYLDLSRIAAELVVKALEFNGIKNYGIKFSGSKGFHVIVSWKAFPEKFDEQETKNMFPEWPRVITEYLYDFIKDDFENEAAKIMSFGKEGKIEIACLNCGRIAKKGIITKYLCPVCGLTAERKDVQVKKKIRCMNKGCAGVLEITDEKEYFYCDFCKDFENEKQKLSSDKNPEMFKEKRGEDISKHAKFDLVLVAPRHLFRMPYSLHEKTSLSSIPMTKDEIKNFNPRDANPLGVKIIDYYPKNEKNEGEKLLRDALHWKKQKNKEKEETEKKYYSNYKLNNDNKEFEEIKAEDVKEEFYPDPIKKLLLGLRDGKKRGLFVLITFFRSLNLDAVYINEKIREWNKKNEKPLKEGYIKSQIDWNLRQKRKILPPNYDNEAFYKDLGLLDKIPEVKNPVVEVARRIRAGRRK